MSGNDEQTRSLTSPEVVREIVDGLKEINTSLNSIRDEFSSIEVDLARLDDGKPLDEEWKNIAQVNVNVNSDFRKCANGLRASLGDFETTVLKQASPVVDKPDDEVQRKKAGQEAGFVLEDAEALQGDVGALVRIFTTFKTRLLKFDETYDAYASRKRTDKGKQIKAKKDEIKQLETKREGIRQKMKDVVREHLKHLTGPRFKWIWDLPIARIITILLELIASEAVKKEIEKLQKEYDDLTQQIIDQKIELAQLQAESDKLEDIGVKLFLQASIHLSQVENGANLFKELFDLFNADCTSVSEYLKAPATSKVPDILREYMSQRQSVYKPLVEALAVFTIS